jgi:drug/metabolite transporter (DMT)-like permease
MAASAHGSRDPVRPAAGAGRTAPGERLGAHAALLAVQLFFGLFPLFGKWAFEAPDGFAPRAVASWRIAFGALALGTLAFLAHGRAALPRARELPRLALCALLGVVLNQVLFLEGLERSTASHAGLVMCLIPVFTFGLAVLARQERLSGPRAAGLALALAGASALVLVESESLLSGVGLGDLLMALNALSYSAYLVVGKPLFARHPPLAVIAGVYVLSVPALPFLSGPADLVAAEGLRPWASLAYVLVFPTTLAYLLNGFALARVRASTTAVYVYLQPLIAASAGILVLGEALTPGLVLAALAIFAGIALVSQRARARPSAAPAHGEPVRP